VGRQTAGHLSHRHRRTGGGADVRYWRKADISPAGGADKAMAAPCRLPSDFDLLGYAKGVIYLDPEVAHCAFELRVP